MNEKKCTKRSINQSLQATAEVTETKESHSPATETQLQQQQQQQLPPAAGKKNVALFFFIK